MRCSRFIIGVALVLCVSCERSLFFEEKPTISKEAKSSTTPAMSILSIQERHGLSKLFLKEMYREVYGRTLKDPKVYGEWMNVLEQGASVEGVYRGLIQSKEYRRMERKQRRATSFVLRFFGEELALLKLKKSVMDGATKNLARVLVHKSQRLSVFTLKRLLGDELLARIEGLKGNHEQLAQWFGTTAVRWSELGVDFSLEKRNIKDVDYHRSWAKGSNAGRIQWEVLFRMHRLMNHYGKIVIAE